MSEWLTHGTQYLRRLPFQIENGIMRLSAGGQAVLSSGLLSKPVVRDLQDYKDTTTDTLFGLQAQSRPAYTQQQMSSGSPQSSTVRIRRPPWRPLRPAYNLLSCLGLVVQPDLAVK